VLRALPCLAGIAHHRGHKHDSANQEKYQDDPEQR